MLSHGLKGDVFGQVGEPIHFCIQSNQEITIGELTEYDACKLKLRARPRATAIKMPALHGFFGTKNAVSRSSDVLVSMKQLKHLFDEICRSYPKIKKQFNEKLIEFPKSSYSYPKITLFIKLVDNTNKHNRSVLKNNLLNFANDDSLTAFDGVTFMEDIEQRMGLLDFFNIAISLVCFTLGFF